MARPASTALTARPGTRPLVLMGALVLVAHLLLLATLDRLWANPTALKPLVPPMLTRQISPAEPVAPPPPVARKRPARPAATAIATAPTTPVTPEPPETVASAPEPAPPPMAEASAVEAPPAETTPQPTQAGTDTPLEADRWPPNTRLNYRLTGYYRGELSGNAAVAWQRDGARYQAQVDMTVGLIVRTTLTSQGEITPEGLVPRQYEEQLGTRRRAVRLADDTITLANGKQLPRPAGVQDTASQFVALTQRFATGQTKLVAGESVKFWMARPGGVDAWDYRVVGQEQLFLPSLGEVTAWHLKPEPLVTPRGSIVAEMWFAPSLQYLPVRIRISFNEENHVDLLVNTIEQR